MACRCHATRLTFYRTSFHVGDVEMAQEEVIAFNFTDKDVQLLIPALCTGLLGSNERKRSQRQQCLLPPAT
jgi:hypothetical protein